jgi:alpha-galactosidase
MKKIFLKTSLKCSLSTYIILTICLLFGVAFSAGALENGLARTPPMGWNSWNKFALNINETIIRKVADSIVAKGLKNAGYAYIIIDDGWSAGRDKNGILVADKTKFPSGMKALADYVHSKGLKLGMYTDVGDKTCGGYAGSYNYEITDANTFAGWGVDYLKEDWCNTTGLDAQTQYKIMSNALVATGRPILFSLCEWGLSSPWQWASGVGNIWRATADIADCWDCTAGNLLGWTVILEQSVNLAPYAGPGHWNDPDMLEVGNSGLTLTESRSHFSMWCMLAAPLIAGNDITSMNDSIKNILTAPEIIAIDQDSLGLQATRVRNAGGLQVWQKPLNDGSIAVALLNLSTAAKPMLVTWNDIGLVAGSATVRDLWSKTDLGTFKDTFAISVPTHGVVMVKIKGQRQRVSKLSLNQSVLTISKGNSSIITATVIPSKTILLCTSTDPSIASVSIAGTNKYSITAHTPGNCVIHVVTADKMDTVKCPVQVVAANLPLHWGFNDINETNGSAVFENNAFTVVGGGTDIWNQSDQFAYLNVDTCNSQSISARVISQVNSDPWAKAGLMFRETANAGSSFAMLFLSPFNGIHLQYRDGTGNICNDISCGSYTLPVFLKLDRTDSTFVASKSTNGSTWTPIGTYKNLTFTKKFKVGLLVNAHSTTNMGQAKFDSVKIIPKNNIASSVTTINETKYVVNIFPNPVNNNLLNVQISNSGYTDKVELSIMNVESRVIYSQKNCPSSFTVNMKNYPSGVYLVSTVINKILYQNKIIKN